jgi:excinuclease ABC subunit B
MFKLVSDFKPEGDQPTAIAKLTEGLRTDKKHQVLLGVTGSGKTFTMAKTIEHAGLPTLVISPNKILAAQLYQEFKAFFPKNQVHYFVSYYDYYQPEAYLPATNTYIAKDARINKDIDRLRHAALQAVLARRDVIIIASVSCIYGVGDPAEYERISLDLKPGQKISPLDVGRHLNFLQYERLDHQPDWAGQFKIEKDTLWVTLITGEKVLIKFKNKKILSITEISTHSTSSGQGGGELDSLKVFPAKFWVTPRDRLRVALANVKKELAERV